MSGIQITAMVFGIIAMLIILAGAVMTIKSWRETKRAGIILMAGALLLMASDIVFFCKFLKPAKAKAEPVSSTAAVLPQEKEVTDYLNKAMAIVKDWDYTELLSRATPQLKSDLPEALMKEKLSFFEQLGKMAGSEKPSGMVYSCDMFDGSKSTFGDYCIKAKFDKGPATISYQLQLVDGTWKINSFDIQSKGLPDFEEWKQKASAAAAAAKAEAAKIAKASEEGTAEGAKAPPKPPPKPETPEEIEAKRIKELNAVVTAMTVNGLSPKGVVINGQYVGIGDDCGPQKALTLVKMSEESLGFVDKNGHHYTKKIKMTGVPREK